MEIPGTKADDLMAEMMIMPCATILIYCLKAHEIIAQTTKNAYEPILSFTFIVLWNTPCVCVCFHIICRLYLQCARLQRTHPLLNMNTFLDSFLNNLSFIGFFPCAKNVLLNDFIYSEQISHILHLLL